MAGEEGQKATSARWRIGRVAIGVGNVLYAGFVLLVFYWAFSDFGSTASAAVQVLLIVATIAQVLAGAALAKGSGWAGRALLGATLAQVVGWGVVVVMTKAVGWWFPALPAVLSVALVSMPQFGVKLRGGDGGLELRPLHIGLILGGLGLIYLVSVEAGSVSKELRAYQHEAKCEDENSLSDCRQAAMFDLQLAEDFDTMKKAEARFAPLCEQGNGAACRSIGYARSDYFAHLGPSRDVIREHIESVAPKACREGDGRGCAVAVWFTEDDRDAHIEKAEELCRGGDRDACTVYIQLAGEHKDADSPRNVEMEKVACKAGVKALCKTTVEPRTRCLLGQLDACAEAAKAAPELKTLAAAHRKVGNPGLYGVKPPADQKPFCEEGDTLACLFAGLELLTDVPKPPSKTPPLPPKAELDATLGHSCDEGVALACLAYGFRLLDRGIDEQRDFERANGWLKKGCDLGSEAACREISFEPQLMKHDYEGYRKQKARSCMHTGNVLDCRSYVSLLAFDIGATPWPISDDIAYVHLRYACSHTKNPMACANAAAFLQGLDITPEYQLTALDLGRTACKKRYAEGCQTMFWSADRWWPGHTKALREKICSQVPSACRK